MEAGSPSQTHSGSEFGAAGPVPVIVHLSGSRRGTTQRLRGNTLRIGTAPDTEIHVAHEPAVADYHASLRRAQIGYDLVTEGDSPVWVNGRPITTTRLESGDVIEVGRDGPILRYRLYPPGSRAYKSPQEAFSDCIDCARNSSTSSVGQAATMMAIAPRELATQTSLWFRAAVIVAIGVLLGLMIAQWRSVSMLSDRIEQRDVQIEGLSELLEDSTEELTQQDLEKIRSEITLAVERVEALEARSGAAARVVSKVSGSVALLQGAFGFVEPKSGQSLRFALANPGGDVIVGPEGPAVTVGGSGPPVEIVYTGTGFVGTEHGLFLTNRHVAQPWDYDDSARQVMDFGLTPVMNRLWGYLPGKPEPIPMNLIAVSADADLAVLQPVGPVPRTTSLPLSSTIPEVGDEVLVLGYPTGIRALVARTDEAMVQRFADRGRDLDVWEIAQQLAESGFITPLASRGIVAQVTDAAVVFDAETTQGGSGGPILDLEGHVVAVTSAVVPEFGGSNLGVPAEAARLLLVEATARTVVAPPFH